MILCDAVHVDSTTGKQTILGTFSTVTADQFPATIVLCVYFAITDAQGEFHLKFRIVDSRHAFEDDSQPVLELEVTCKSPSPLAVCESMIAGPLQLPSAGVYHCELLVGDNLLMSRRLVAVTRAEIGGKK